MTTHHQGATGTRLDAERGRPRARSASPRRKGAGGSVTAASRAARSDFDYDIRDYPEPENVPVLDHNDWRARPSAAANLVAGAMLVGFVAVMAFAVWVVAHRISELAAAGWFS